MIIDELIALIIILVFSFGITIPLKEPLNISFLLMAGITGLLYAFNLVPYYFVIIALILLSYSIYTMIWGGKNKYE